MYVLLKRSRRVIAEPSYIQTEWLHPFPTSDCETFEERRRSSLIPTTSSTKHETPGGLLTNSLIIENHNFPQSPASV